MLKDANGKVYASGLDIAIEVEDKEITARQLFEAAAEDLTYANHINADVEYSYSEDTRYTGDLNMGNLMFNKSFDIKATLLYDRYFLDDKNNMSVLNGTGSSYYSATGGIASDYNQNKSMASEYTWYKGLQNGEPKTAFLYDGDSECSPKIDVMRILALSSNDLSGMNVEIFYYPDSVDKTLGVKIEGDDLSYFLNSFQVDNDVHAQLDNVTYYFNYDTKSLRKVYVKGSHSSPTVYLSDYETLYLFETDIKINAIEYGQVEMPEIPDVVVENSQLNGFLTGDSTIVPNAGITMPFIEGTQWAEDARIILTRTLSKITDEGFSIQRYSEAIGEAAKETGYEKVKAEYNVDENETLILVRFTFDKDGQEAGSIFVPIIMTADGLICGTNMVVLSEDMVSVYEDGSIMVIHSISDSLWGEMLCTLDEYGRIIDKYTKVEESKISNLLLEEEMNAFSSMDSKGLTNLANNYDYAKYTSVTKLTVLEDGVNNVYYCVGRDEDTTALENLTGLKFLDQDKLLSKTEMKKVNEVTEWQILGE